MKRVAVWMRATNIEVTRLESQVCFIWLHAIILKEIHSKRDIFVSNCAFS